MRWAEPIEFCHYEFFVSGSKARSHSVTIRTSNKTVTFRRPFWLKGVDRMLPPADYRVVTDEELIEGLSFPAYHRVSTVIFVPAPSGSAIEMVTIDPLELDAALEQNAAMPADAVSNATGS
jgi:hypothetical protein